MTRKSDLIARAEVLPGYKKTVHGKNIASLEAFLQTHEQKKKEMYRGGGVEESKVAEPPVAEPVIESKKPTKKEMLMERAEKYPEFKKSIHGKNIASLMAFLAIMEVGNEAASTTMAAITRQTIQRMSLPELRKLAKERGFKVKKATEKQLLDFLLAPAASIELEPEPEPVVAEQLDIGELEEWPVSAEVVAAHSETIERIKELLRHRGIMVGLPRTKKELMELFKKSRCTFENFTCEGDEFCDLRNNLCRDLKILKNQEGELARFAKGIEYEDFHDQGGGRFYGTPDAIARVREALVPSPIEPEPIVDAAPTPAEPIVDAEVETEEGISPININRLLDKPSESEMRKAILNCLGLYNDVIDVNDEIILTR